MAQMQVFVSHSYRDAAFCEALVKGLRDAGADVWFDEHTMGAQQLVTTIERELRRRPVFIVVLSPDALNSKWVEQDTRWAYSLYRQDPTRIILPVLAAPLADESGIWLFLQDFKRIEAAGHQPYSTGETVRRVLHALAMAPSDTQGIAVTIKEAQRPVEPGRAVLSQQVGVFVSHHHSPEEDTFTARLVTDLEAAGADVWVDNKGITSDDFIQKISEGLEGRQWLVLVMTPQSVASKWVRREVNTALNEHTAGRMQGVIPMVATPTPEQDIPMLWRPLHRYDATRSYEPARDALLHALGLQA